MPGLPRTAPVYVSSSGVITNIISFPSVLVWVLNCLGQPIHEIHQSPYMPQPGQWWNWFHFSGWWPRWSSWAFQFREPEWWKMFLVRTVCQWGGQWSHLRKARENGTNWRSDRFSLSSCAGAGALLSGKNGGWVNHCVISLMIFSSCCIIACTNAICTCYGSTL